MDGETVLGILEQGGKLKLTFRHCFFEGGRRESVADHTFRLAFFALILRSEEAFKDVDMDKVIRMCLIHDLGESFTGDIPSFEKTDAETEKEDRTLDEWVSSFPPELREDFQSLLYEMDGLKTKEARVYKALDKLEALITHNESPRETWLPIEYGLQLTYGQENMEASPWFQEIRKLIDEWTLSKTNDAEDRTSF
ncbi:MAG: HD domain-containing protein [Lachnospiraceae bacterium]|nr:HD domain-containing protein [Lachnospiraceae bacterium]